MKERFANRSICIIDKGSDSANWKKTTRHNQLNVDALFFIEYLFTINAYQQKQYLDMKRSLKRIFSNIICLVLLSAGSLLTIFFFPNFEMTRDFEVGTRYVTLFAGILMAIIFLMEISAVIFNKNASKSTLFLAFFVLAFAFSSHDMINMIAYFGPVKYPIVFNYVHSVAFFASMFVIYFYYFKDYQIKNTFSIKIGFSAIVVLFIVDILCIVFDAQFLSSIIIMNFTIVIYFSLFFITYNKRMLDNRFVIIGFIFFILTGTYIAASTGLHFENFPLGLESWGVIVIFALYLMIYADMIVRMFKKSYAAEEYERKIKELQSTILMEQINPHFIFNSLVLIKSIYLTDREKGDRAIDLLSKHIRANVDVKGGKLLIPIEEELKNVQCFVELANMQNNEPLNMVFNIDAYDFMVPILSIEPFIENAIKYSRIQSKEDGYIEVSTAETDTSYIVKISDNGVGFTKEERAKKNSQGIKNALSRFEFLLKASTHVNSVPNKGTTITIIIPKAGR